MAVKGVPVIVVPSGGVPVRAVESRAPLMTVSTNGKGTPITLTNLGTPFIVDGLATPPSNTALPYITGTPRYDMVLTGNVGTWAGDPAPTFIQQWLRDGVAISGATAATYRLVSADAGKNITFRVTATNSAGSATATSAAVGPVTQAPYAIVSPSLAGTPAVGQVLSIGDYGIWGGYPLPPTFGPYLWLRNNVPISGATSSTYTVQPDDAGTSIRCQVEATNTAGSNAVSTQPVSISYSWQAITMTAGDSGDWIGFSNGDIISPPFNPPVGTISAEPTPATQLEALFQDASGDIIVVFQGDWQIKLQSLALTFDSQVLTPNGYSLQGGNTFLRYIGYTGTLADATTYAVSFG